MLTIADIASRLSLKYGSARKVMLRIPHYRIGNLLRCTEAALQEYIERQTEKPVERVLVETRSSHFEFGE